MFAVHSPRTRTGVDLPVPAQFRLVKTALVGQDLIGERGGDLDYGYNPFELYGAASHARGQPLPPHLVFASLDRTVVQDACAFLDAYGPLEGTNQYDMLTADCKSKWEEVSAQRNSPEEHFRAILGQVPLLPPPPIPQDLYHCYNLKQFWEAQSRFELALRLSSALNSPTDQLAEVQRALRRMDEKWNFEGPNAERSYIRRAQGLVFETLNSSLQTMPPRVTRDLSSATAIAGVWPCYALLDAMYLMLFLDIASRGARIAQCEKCARLFYTDREKGKYCSTVCENRARALRAYHRRRATKETT